MTIHWNENTPIYLQIKARVEAMLLDGSVVTGDPVPSVRQIAADLQVNPLTVSRAYQELVDDGMLEVRRGLGMFVTDGASERLLATERERFLNTELPAAVARAKRLGLSDQDLMQAISKGVKK